MNALEFFRRSETGAAAHSVGQDRYKRRIFAASVENTYSDAAMLALPVDSTAWTLIQDMDPGSPTLGQFINLADDPTDGPAA